MKSFLQIVAVVFFSTVLLMSCEDSHSPKPRGYYRIDMPAKKYVAFDSSFPYRFERPIYTSITGDPHTPDEKYWINLNFLPFDATLHLSYKAVKGNLMTYLEDAHKLVTKHIPKADAIYDSIVIDRNRKVFGLIYQLEGSGAATPYQFFLTDSVSHFIRGALYFNTVPNNDSLDPVIQFIEDDLEHLISTFQWQDEGN